MSHSQLLGEVGINDLESKGLCPNYMRNHDSCQWEFRQCTIYFDTISSQHPLVNSHITSNRVFSCNWSDYEPHEVMLWPPCFMLWQRPANLSPCMFSQIELGLVPLIWRYISIHRFADIINNVSFVYFLEIIFCA